MRFLLVAPRPENPSKLTPRNPAIHAVSILPTLVSCEHLILGLARLP